MHAALRSLAVVLSFVVMALAGGSAPAAASNPFVGNWAITLPTGGAGWLGVTEKNGQLEASLLWGGGSVVPVASVKLEGDQLVIVRSRPAPPKPAKPTAKPVKPATETVFAKAAGDALQLTLVVTSGAGKELKRTEFAGKRIPPMPAAPDLAKVKFGPAIKLFNGKDLSGWTLLDPKRVNGWSVVDGALINRPVQEPGKPHGKAYGNLRTEKEFEDCRLTLDVRTQPGSNSGIYLRGIYEVQVLESFGKPLDSHNMGALYSRITPSVNAEKPAGEWQTLDITLVDRHLTVILNGVKTIDNQPVLGCTGGALWSDEFKPGPLFLQGDHTSIDFRNIVLYPVVK